MGMHATEDKEKINKLESQAVERIFHKSIKFTNSDSWMAGRDEVGRVGLGGGCLIASGQSFL